VLEAFDRQHFIPAVTGQGEFHETADMVMTARVAMV
jgi:hypothetical protein